MIIDGTQLSLLVTVAVLSEIVSTAIAQRRFAAMSRPSGPACGPAAARSRRRGGGIAARPG